MIYNLEKQPANHGLWAKPGPLTFFVNQVLLEQSQDHLCYWQWLLICYNIMTGLSSCVKDYLALYRKSLLTLVLESLAYP